ncbi:MAG: hypothetical protein A2162_05925 [Deltaproteobacteria bacterium RBG_13_52_11b]|nr:MAG: hypothetical protein A2162_05925 [Deltaproteobacteria bacterium RBG_13_52_11b]
MGRWRFVGVILIVLFVSFGFCQKGLADERYAVKPGDTLSEISKTFGVSIDVLKKANRLEKDTLKPNQILLIPPRRETRGDETAGGPSEEKKAVEGPLAKWISSEERTFFIEVVKDFLGVPYRLGGATLKGIDCSAFVMKIYEIFNTTLPRTAREQFRVGKSVGKEELQEGDLVFFNTRRSSISHVGIYIGNREFVHASSQNRRVRVDSLDLPYFSKHFLRGGRIKELESDS